MAAFTVFIRFSFVSFNELCNFAYVFNTKL